MVSGLSVELFDNQAHQEKNPAKGRPISCATGTTAQSDAGLGGLSGWAEGWGEGHTAVQEGVAKPEHIEGSRRPCTHLARLLFLRARRGNRRHQLRRLGVVDVVGYRPIFDALDGLVNDE